LLINDLRNKQINYQEKNKGKHQEQQQQQQQQQQQIICGVCFVDHFFLMSFLLFLCELFTCYFRTRRAVVVHGWEI